LFTIGRQLVFSLARWSAQIHTAFHVCRATQGHPRASSTFGHGPITLSGATFQSLNLVSEIQVIVNEPMYSVHYIRVPRDHSLFVSFPRIIADFHALRRLLTPRHPPCALSRLAAEISNSRHRLEHKEPKQRSKPKLQQFYR
jgi:hypothetical protein